MYSACLFDSERKKVREITRAEIEQKSADEFINGLMSRMTVDEKLAN